MPFHAASPDASQTRTSVGARCRAVSEMYRGIGSHQFSDSCLLTWTLQMWWALFKQPRQGMQLSSSERLDRQLLSVRSLSHLDVGADESGPVQRRAVD